MSDLRITPLTLRLANDFVEAHHRHSARTSNDGGKFAIGLMLGDELVGVAIVGRPVARMLQNGAGDVAELLRLCTSPAAPKGSGSKLYARAKRIWQLMGGSRFVTYTLTKEMRDGRRPGLARSSRVAAPERKSAAEEAPAAR